MLFSAFLSVALLVPLLFVSDVNSANRKASSLEESQGRRELSLSDPFLDSNEDSFFADDFFANSPQNSRKEVADPVLRDLIKEEERLGLSGSNDDIGSQEARDLIDFQRQKLNNQQRQLDESSMNRESRGGFSFSSEGGSPVFVGPNDQKFNAEYLTSTQYPILRPPRVPEEEVMSTAAPIVGRMGALGLVNNAAARVGGVIGSIRNTFRGAPKTTTTTPPSMFFEGEDNVYEVPNQPSFPLPPSRDSTKISFNNPDVSALIPPPMNLESQRLNCNETETKYNGGCYKVLEQLPCLDEGQWLIEDELTGKGKCVENKCAKEKGRAWFAGECVVIREQGSCHKGMTTYIFKNGDVECDCKDLHLFNMKDSNCYPAYRQGPCRPGEMFVSMVAKQGRLPPTCVKNKCGKDGLFCNAPACPNGRNCIELGRTKCSIGVIDIDPVSLTPKCLDMSRPNRIIGNVPTLACAPGSRRDILGTCRKPTKITFS